MDNQEIFDALLNCLKKLEENMLDFPIQGEQKSYKVVRVDDVEEKFVLIINRKGHLNKQNLTYQMMSKSLNGVLVRLDWNGAPHEYVPTPHIHIFDEAHDFGRVAEPLDYVPVDVMEELYESLLIFLDYTHTNHQGLSIQGILT